MFEQIIIYDVQDDSLRTKVQQLIQEAGLTRLQYSVYAGTVKKEIIENLLLELRWLIRDEIADVRIIFPCMHINLPVRIVVDNYPPQPAELRQNKVFIP
jgi:CRISPR-associated endonuclease Cas2